MESTRQIDNPWILIFAVLCPLFPILLYRQTWRQSHHWQVNSVLLSPNLLPYCVVIGCLSIFYPAAALLSYWLLVAVGNMRRLVAVSESLHRIQPSCKSFIFAMIGPIMCAMQLGTMLLITLMSAHPSFSWTGWSASPNVVATLGFCCLLVFLSWLGSTLSTNAINQLKETDPVFVPLLLQWFFDLVIIGSWLLLGGTTSWVVISSISTPHALLLVPAAVYLFCPLKSRSVTVSS